MNELIDRFNRKIDYLRISVTDRCNLRCIYCMPAWGIINRPHQELLSFEEITRIVKVFTSVGINKIRITGGEPLVRKGLVSLINSLAKIEGIKDLSMTTNGTLLAQYTRELKDAGLNRLNISLDTLEAPRYKFITRLGNIEDVKEGIQKALDVGFSPLKINVLLLAGINTGEIKDFARLTLGNPIHVRFLEFMPTQSSMLFETEGFFASCKQAMSICSELGRLEPQDVYANGPAKTFSFKNSLGSIGFISALSDKFCYRCNRLRLTSDGVLRNCLYSDTKVDLKAPLRSGANSKQLIHLIRWAVYTKPKDHSLDTHPIDSSGSSEYLMCQIGG